MKVILLKDVAKVGRRFDVVNVPDGHALNMLIPKGLAKPGTPENIRSLEAQKARTAEDRQAEGELFKEAADKAVSMTLSIKAAANEQGHLFQALKPEIIAGAYGQVGVKIASGNISINKPIKSLGEHVIELVSGKERVSVKIELSAE